MTPSFPTRRSSDLDEIGGIARRGALDVVLPDDLRLQRNARPHGLVFDLRNDHVAPRELVRKILAVLLMRVEAQTVRADAAGLIGRAKSEERRDGKECVGTCSSR